MNQRAYVEAAILSLKMQVQHLVHKGNDHDEIQTSETQCIFGEFGFCENVYQHHTVIDDWELFTLSMGLETSDPLTCVPLCKVHYNKWDEVSKERRCSNCNKLIRRINGGKKYCVRNYDEVRNFIEETGNRIKFLKDQKVCQQCYYILSSS